MISKPSYVTSQLVCRPNHSCHFHGKLSECRPIRLVAVLFAVMSMENTASRIFHVKVCGFH